MSGDFAAIRGTAAGVRERLRAITGSLSLPQHDALVLELDALVSALETEPALYRPRSGGKAGGLIDFTDAARRAVPTVVVPDLHARWYFLLHLLEFTPPSLCGPGRSVLDLLAEGRLRVVCMGDYFHSEARGYERWLRAYSDWLAGRSCGVAMTQEMRECVALLRIIALLKTRFPGSFHVLKGNHENIYNRSGGGDRAFMKFVEEGEMVRDFVREYYGDAVLHLIGCYEDALPVCAAGNNFVVSHAEPARGFTREEIIDCRRSEDVLLGLTWTNNGEALPGSCAEVVRNLGASADPQSAWYFAGHRPIDGDYRLGQSGVFVQIHNPERENVALIGANGSFSPEKSILSVAPAAALSEEEGT